MLVLNYIVDGQKLKAVNADNSIVRGTKGFLKCSFDFQDREWNNCKVAAVFEVPGGEQYPVAVSRDRTCPVPDEVTDGKSIKLHLIGVNRIGYKITTNKILITQGG